MARDLKNLIRVMVIFKDKCLGSNLLCLTPEKLKKFKQRLKEEGIVFKVESHPYFTGVDIHSKTSYTECFKIIGIISDFKKAEEDIPEEDENNEFS